MVKLAEKPKTEPTEKGWDDEETRNESIDIERMDREHRRTLIRQAVRYGSMEPEDVVQEVMIKAHKALNKEEPAKLTRGWYMRAAATTAIDSYRKAKRNDNYGLMRSEADYNKYHQHTMDTPDDDSNGELEYVESEVSIIGKVQSRVDELLADMSVQRKDIYRMYFVEGMEYKAISEKLNVPLGTVRSSINRIRSVLTSDPELMVLNKEK